MCDKKDNVVPEILVKKKSMIHEVCLNKLSNKGSMDHVNKIMISYI